MEPFANKLDHTIKISILVLVAATGLIFIIHLAGTIEAISLTCGNLFTYEQCVSFHNFLTTNCKNNNLLSQARKICSDEVNLKKSKLCAADICAASIDYSESNSKYDTNRAAVLGKARDVGDIDSSFNFESDSFFTSEFFQYFKNFYSKQPKIMPKN